ncbi:MAG: DUF4358 domain-containing protein [Oscillospiraceae bacterium]|nr:DUF4358 domain-containing protein [Oscillospiraceae bacterium]
MKLSKQKAAAFLAALLALALLCACGGSAGKNVPASELAAAVSGALGKTDALASNDGTFLGLSGAAAADLGDYAILINRYGANIDEFGVFHASGDGASAREIKTVAEAYLARRLEVWMEEYMPEEKPKLENAEVRVSGDYVIYCILSDADKAAAFRAFEDALK